MSPGPTFDRVYASLKAQLFAGQWAPGARLEPAAIGEDLAASITPVRDALHRLVGERLVDAPRHDGFWVPALTESELKGLYSWNGTLIGLALRAQPHRWPLWPEGTRAADIAAIFNALARSADSPELAHAIAASVDRLAEYRAVEPLVLTGLAEELDEIVAAAAASGPALLRRALGRYHRRRERAAPPILAARRNPGGALPPPQA